MKLLLLTALLSALLGMSHSLPLKGRASKVMNELIHQGLMPRSWEHQKHPSKLLDLTWTREHVPRRDGGHGGHGEEDPEPASQILKVNKAIGTFPPGTPPLEFGDIAVDPLGNADQCASDRCRWPSAANGQVLVPFEISAAYSPNERAVITDAIASFARSTCVNFKPRANERDYIFIEPQSGCWSFIGRIGGRQVVSLQRNGCVFTGTAQHELLHALGFHHEQNRSDRDDFVTVFLQNVMPGMEHNFRKVNTNNLGTRYDYASIMHYSRNAFSRNGRPTLAAKPDPNVPIGTSRQFTATDIAKVNSLYCSRGTNERILR